VLGEPAACLLCRGDSHTSKVAAGIVVGAVNAMVATLFYFLLEGSLFTVWEWIPQQLWAPLVGDSAGLRHAYTVLVPTGRPRHRKPHKGSSKGKL
jgi:hypothetical protein